MPAPDLDPQVPGEQATTAQEPTGNPLIDLPALAEQNVPEVTAGLADLTTEELQALHDIESDQKQRKGVLEAIDAELAAREDDAEPEAEADLVASKVVTKIPERFESPVLTAKGWVVPEPHQKPGAKA